MVPRQWETGDLSFPSYPPPPHNHPGFAVAVGGPLANGYPTASSHPPSCLEPHHHFLVLAVFAKKVTEVSLDQSHGGWGGEAGRGYMRPLVFPKRGGGGRGWGG